MPLEWLRRDRVERADETLIFLHLPKTAGQTFTLVLERQYGTEEICELYQYPAREALSSYAAQPLEVRERHRFITGHMHFGVHEHVPGPSTYTTLLRKPVKLCLSAYNHILRKANHPRHEAVRELGLEGVVRDGLLLFFDNGQTRALCGSEAESVPYGKCTLDMVEKAGNTLDRYMCMTGTTEMFDESLLLLGERFAWKNLFYSRRNTAPARSKVEPPPAALDLLQTNNWLDAELYERVQKNLATRLDELGPRFASRVRRFKRLNRAWTALRLG